MDTGMTKTKMTMKARLDMIDTAINESIDSLNLSGMFLKISSTKILEILELINEKCLNLEVLILNNNNLSCLNNLENSKLFSNLTKLVSLEVQNCKLSNISYIKLPDTLKVLDIKDNTYKLLDDTFALGRLFLVHPGLEQIKKHSLIHRIPHDIELKKHMHHNTDKIYLSECYHSYYNYNLHNEDNIVSDMIIKNNTLASSFEWYGNLFRLNNVCNYLQNMCTIAAENLKTIKIYAIYGASKINKNSNYKLDNINFSKFTNLHTLVIRGIESKVRISKENFNLPQLRTLRLVDASIKNINMNNLYGLQKLYMKSCTGFTTKSIINCANLVKLTMRGSINLDKNLPFYLQKLTNLKKLSIHRILFNPVEYFNIQSLEILKISIDNLFENDLTIKHNNNIKTLHLTFYRKTEAALDISLLCPNLLNLKFFASILDDRIYYSRLYYDYSSVFKNLTKLKTLIFINSSNSSYVINNDFSDNISNLMDLEEVEIDGVHVSSFNNAWNNINKLHKLTIKSSEIKEFGNMFDNKPNLEFITFYHMRTNTIPESFFNLHNIKKILIDFRYSNMEDRIRNAYGDIVSYSI